MRPLGLFAASKGLVPTDTRRSRTSREAPEVMEQGTDRENIDPSYIFSQRKEGHTKPFSCSCF